MYLLDYLVVRKGLKEAYYYERNRWKTVLRTQRRMYIDFLTSNFSDFSTLAVAPSGHIQLLWGIVTNDLLNILNISILLGLTMICQGPWAFYSTWLDNDMSRTLVGQRLLVVSCNETTKKVIL